MGRAVNFGRQADACNDNGLPALVTPALAPRDVLTVARRSCGPVALSYLAAGCLLVGAAGPRRMPHAA
ncbi:hypothetical protein [Enterovirga aerilata]|uniref:Uncharacterized protein n=1 Tax=Enterovirga aerilata TaxID=2730920 RepID=A0A849IBM9_9HYPH|nr:hypothetical protein [Enterovirga sp. DB1703]NNM71333.1 hypothetical protein [Enterovirga sp. DB1703]